MPRRSDCPRIGRTDMDGLDAYLIEVACDADGVRDKHSNSLPDEDAARERHEWRDAVRAFLIIDTEGQD